MKILVIGGSYFLGRVFVMCAAKEHEVTVLNRGTYSMEALGARQITGDRRDVSIWRDITETFDVVIDFCAYNPEDISIVFSNIGSRITHYIFVSTVDVYEHGSFELKNEEYKLESRIIQDEAGDYIKGKIALEKELKSISSAQNLKYTILRPAIIYGPFNYAPRESVYIQLMVRDKILPHIVDTHGKFQLVYVKDVANAILKCIGNDKAYNNTYNISGDELLDYDGFYKSLAQASDIEFTELPMTVDEAQQKGVPLPFAVNEMEIELTDNSKSKAELGISYTPANEGMAKTYNAFKNVFTPQ
jgi:nucleoside-diphosphate-sugar epimerase